MLFLKHRVSYGCVQSKLPEAKRNSDNIFVIGRRIIFGDDKSAEFSHYTQQPFCFDVC